MRAVIVSVMRKRKQKIEQLTAVDLSTFGHLICGLYPSEIKRLSPYNLRSVVTEHEIHEQVCTKIMLLLNNNTPNQSRPNSFLWHIAL